MVMKWVLPKCTSKIRMRSMPTTITEIEFYVLNAPSEERPHWVSLFRVPNANELLVRMKSSDGVEGFGLATSYTDISPIAHERASECMYLPLHRPSV